MAKRQNIILGDKEFSSKKEAAKHVRSIMTGYVSGKHLVGEDFIIATEVLRLQNKVGSGIDDIMIMSGIGSDRYFWIDYKDGTSITSGYRGAFFPKKNIERFKGACRELTGPETYGELAFFPIEAKPPNTQVHHVVPFSTIINNFINEYNIDVDTVKYKQDKRRIFVFTDEKLKQRIMEYYRQFGVLRILPIEAHKIETKKREWKQ